MSGAPFKKFASMREEWSLMNRYISPGIHFLLYHRISLRTTLGQCSAENELLWSMCIFCFKYFLHEYYMWIVSWFITAAFTVHTACAYEAPLWFFIFLFFFILSLTSRFFPFLQVPFNLLAQHLITLATPYCWSSEFKHSFWDAISFSWEIRVPLFPSSFEIFVMKFSKCTVLFFLDMIFEMLDPPWLHQTDKCCIMSVFVRVSFMFWVEHCSLILYINKTVQSYDFQTSEGVTITIWWIILCYFLFGELTLLILNLVYQFWIHVYM